MASYPSSPAGPSTLAVPVAPDIDLSQIPLTTAVDALVTAYFSDLSILLRAYGRKGKGKELDDQHEESLERRALERMFEEDLSLGEDGQGSRSGNEEARTGGAVEGEEREVAEDCHHISEVLGLTLEEKKDWVEWVPDVGQQVLVYLSEQRGLWPGKIIHLKYFSDSCLPGLPSEQLYAVRIYPSKQAPTLTIKSHMLPLHHHPIPPSNASPTLLRGYETAANSSIYDQEAESLETKMRASWGRDPQRQEADGGGSWSARVWWLEKEARQEKATSGGMTLKEREDVMASAKKILGRVWGEGDRPAARKSAPAKGKANGAQNGHGTPPSYDGNRMDEDLVDSNNVTPTGNGQGVNTPSPSLFGRISYRRARRKFNSLLNDPILLPVLEGMDLSPIQNALVIPKSVPLYEGAFPPPSLPEIGPFSYTYTMSSKRKRTADELSDVGEEEEDEDDLPRGRRQDFASPLTGKVVGGLGGSKLRVEAVLREDEEMDMDARADSEDGGWRVYSRKRRRKTMG